MKENIHMREGGQTLVIVALAMAVLMLMAGLAVDVGMAYNERRDMQNAADAAALAGAQRLCDGSTQSVALNAAVSAGQLNGATTVSPSATVAEDARRMHAVASTDSDTFFFRLLGVPDIPVSAEAMAECSCSASIGGAWPIAFDQPQWDTLGCLNKDTGQIIGGSPHILLWVDDNVDQYLGDNYCSYCDCTRLQIDLGISSLMAYGGNPFGSGDRGWVKLATPPGFEDTQWGGQNCEGADTLKFWMLYGYPGQVAQGKCVPTKPGVTTSVLHAGTDGTIPRDVAVLLYDPDPDSECTSADAIGCTSKDMLKISGTGCVTVQAIWYDFSLVDLPGVKPDCPNIKKNQKVIVATKLCGCTFSGSGSSGGASSSTCVPAVSLVQ